MKSDKERELWLLKVTDELAADEREPAKLREANQRADPARIVKWGAVAVAGMTAASLVVGP